MDVDAMFAAQVQMNELRNAEPHRSASMNDRSNVSPNTMKKNLSSPSKIFKQC